MVYDGREKYTCYHEIMRYNLIKVKRDWMEVGWYYLPPSFYKENNMCEHNISGSGSVRDVVKERAVKRINKAKRGPTLGAFEWILICATVMTLGFGVALMIHDAVPGQVSSLPAVISDVRSSVVHVGKLGVCQGSGVALTEDIVMTARHVTDGDAISAYVVTLDDGNTVPVLKVLEDKENDLAYLKVAKPVLKPAVMADRNPVTGEMIIVFGSPLGFQNFNTASPGYITSLDRDLYNREGWDDYQYLEWHQMIQSNAPAFPGNSGGPVFNLQGDVCGILVAGMDPSINYSVPVERFRKSMRWVVDAFDMDRWEVLDPRKIEVKSEYETYGDYSD